MGEDAARLGAPIWRFHRGAPLKSEYRKLPSSADCTDCGWKGASGVTAGSLERLRVLARDHAAVKHHRVVIHLAQDVALEPKHPQTREKALAALHDEIREGIAASERGETADLGSFAQYGSEGQS